MQFLIAIFLIFTLFQIFHPFIMLFLIFLRNPSHCPNLRALFDFLLPRCPYCPFVHCPKIRDWLPFCSDEIKIGNTMWPQLENNVDNSSENQWTFQGVILNIIVNHFIKPSIFVLAICPYTIDGVFCVNALLNEHSLDQTTSIFLHRHYTPLICHQSLALSERSAKLALKEKCVK